MKTPGLESLRSFLSSVVYDFVVSQQVATRDLLPGPGLHKKLMVDGRSDRKSKNKYEGRERK